MTIQNAQIKSVVVELDERKNLCVFVKSKGQIADMECSFILKDEADNTRLTKIMELLGVSKLNELEGKVIRQILVNKQVKGIGHPIEDRYIPLLEDKSCGMTEKAIEECFE